ncbi:MAG TPA: hypothetical protein VJ867_01415 [Gemmatimonadaceae bacterium]|nr:hypothetical protein [Gemmatimonadaceae bacterium]
MITTRMTALAVCVAAATSVAAQQPQSAGAVTKTAKSYTPPPVFLAEQPLEVTLVAPFKQLKRDRRGTTPYRPGELLYAGDSGTVRVPVRLRTRGIWRREHCEIPPLRLNFSKDSTKKTEFRHLDRVRLVLPCRLNDDYEQYVLREFQLYRVQRLITPLALNTRLVHVTYIDAEHRDTLARRYSFLLEEDQDFAARQGGKALDTKGAAGEDLNAEENARFGVFQYFIGNTDFSISALHNVLLFGRDTSYFPVAYDFDWSGAVNTRYAVPSNLLPIKRVTERIMRGYCAEPSAFEQVFGTFRQKKDAIYALYAPTDAFGALMKPDDVKQTLRYFDQFYDVINDPRSAKRQIVDACLGGRA